MKTCFGTLEGWLRLTALCKALGAKALWRDYTKARCVDVSTRVAGAAGARRTGVDTDAAVCERHWARAEPREALVRKMLREVDMDYLIDYYMVKQPYM